MKTIEEGRSWLKAEEWDAELETDQRRGVPHPPLQKPVPELRGVRSCDATLGLSRSSPHPADGAAGLGVDPWNCCPQFFPSRNTKNEDLTPLTPDRTA